MIDELIEILLYVPFEVRRNFQVLNLSRNCYENEDLICDFKNRLDRKENSILSMSTNIYFIVNRFLKRKENSILNFLLLFLLIIIFLEMPEVLMQTV